MESIIIAKNSVDENRAYNSNLFYGIFMVGNVFGNLFAYVLLDVFQVVGMKFSNHFMNGFSSLEN